MRMKKRDGEDTGRENGKGRKSETNRKSAIGDRYLLGRALFFKIRGFSYPMFPIDLPGEKGKFLMCDSNAKV